LYYPEDTSTGYVMTKIAEGLSEQYAVGVLCSQPTYAKRGMRAPKHEFHNNVEIFRCRGTTFNKDSLALRLVNLLTISLSIWFTALWRLRRNDCVIVVTNPPSLPFLIAFACWIKGAKCLLLVHDLYPEVLTAAEIVRREGIAMKVIGFCSRMLYRNVAAIIALGRDMEERIRRHAGQSNVPISIIPNWSDLSEIRPLPKELNRLLKDLQLQEKFVVQYCGNMGRTHGLETLFEAARRLRGVPEVHFLFVGSGAKKQWLEDAAKAECLPNVSILSRRPRNDLNDTLNACDVSVISFVKGMAGISVPSRMYNALAAGTPILAIADADSELALVVQEECVGWVVPPEDPDIVVKTVLQARDDRDSLKAMGIRARESAEKKYSFVAIIGSYQELISKLVFKGSNVSSTGSGTVEQQLEV
jgi:colanic acid biosynthesis glycosyl transferase WcaI